MMKFKGKKLLILGSNAGSVDLVQYAKANGAVVYVADYFDIEKSEAKRFADVPVNISTADLDGLSELICREKIDGVFSGISGFNILNAMKLADKFGFRFYCSQKQWEQIEHKDNFRNLCQKYNVPCPKTYYIGKNKQDIALNSLVYPVVVKPVDSGASSGVHICMDQDDLLNSIDDAFACSEKSTIILEEFVTGYEFTVHYTICHGKAALSSIDNRYPVAVNEGHVTTIPVARIYPSAFLNEYIQRVDPRMVSLCENIGLENAVLFVQGLYNDETGEFSIFEAGMRSAAECPSRITEVVTGQNPLFMILDYILSGTVDYDLSLEAPDLHGRCGGIVSFVAKGGTVGKIEGLEETIKCVPSVVKYENRYPVGSVAPDGNTLRQLMLRFIMVCESREEMVKDIAYLNDHINVYDTEGKNMVVKIIPERILGLD